jgi:hypothetical protein
MAALNLHPTAFPKIEAACPELDGEQIATLAQFATSRQFKAGETLLSAGEQELKLFVVKSGEVEIRDGPSGEIVTVLGPRQFTGEVDLLEGRPSAVSAVAKTDCDTYEVSAPAPPFCTDRTTGPKIYQHRHTGVVHQSVKTEIIVNIDRFSNRLEFALRLATPENLPQSFVFMRLRRPYFAQFNKVPRS